ncbi:MAG: ABC transporter permease [Patescibacteria group bacterium]|nr:MAG: ABC transporter permease [Patescibacteria group bacterium]
MVQRLKTYFTIWSIFGKNALQETFVNRGSNALFMLGKIIRLAMSLLFLFLIRQNVQTFADYTSDQLVVFFLTYQIIDLVAQVVYRGVYVFGNMVRSGEFDFLLVKPINPLFRALTGKPDINDFLFLFPNLAIAGYLLSLLDLHITVWSSVWFIILLVNAFLVVTALHILVLVTGILTTEVDGVIWIYRDLSYMGRFPISIYMEPLRFALFFLVPIGIMITIPTEVFLGLQPSYSLFWVFFVGIGSLFFSLKAWNWALKKYTSTGS